MNELLFAALAYAQRGWRVFPLHGIINGACTCGRSDCSSPGKHPLVRRGLYEATTEPDVILGWWRRWRRANIGIATGAESGIAVIDVDLGHGTNTAFGSPGDGTPSKGQAQAPVFDSLARLLDVGLPATLTALTGGGGVHLIYRCNDAGLGNSAGKLPGLEVDLPGIDLRANGGYIVAPPSVHRSGAHYEWLEPNRDLAATPQWLQQPERSYAPVDVAAPASFEGDGTPYGLAVLRDELDNLRTAQAGTRNHQLNRCGFALAQLVAGGELLETAARSSLLASALAIGLDQPESRQTIDRAFDAGLRQPRCAPHRVKG